MEISNAKNHLFLRFLAAVAATVFPNCYHLFAAHAARTLKEEMQKIRKVKAVSPSPFYDGKYHPPFIQQYNCFIKMNLLPS